MKQETLIIRGLTLRTFFIFLLVIILVVGIYYLWAILVPFFVALLIAYLIDPLVKFLESNNLIRLRRTWAVSLVFIIFISIFIVLLVVLLKPLAKEAGELIKEVPKYSKVVENEYNFILDKLNTIGIPIQVDEIKGQLVEITGSLFTDFLSFLRKFFSSALNSILLYLILVPLFTFYFLKDKYKIFNTIKKFIKDEKEKQIKSTFDEVNEKIGGYIKSIFLTSVLVGFTVSTTLCFFDNIPSPILLGVLAGIANIIPYIGPIIGSAPPLLIAMVSYSSNEVITLAIFFIILNLLVGMVIQPKITSKAVNIHPITVILSVLIGGNIFGITGMLLAVPFAIIIKVLLLLVFKIYIKEV